MQSVLYAIYILVNLLLIIGLFYFTGKLLLIFLSLLKSYKGDCPYVPTKSKLLKRAFAMLEIEAGERVLDIGSGDGKFLFFGSKRVKAEFIGIEINWVLVVLSKLKKIFISTKGNEKIIKGNFLSHDFGGYDKIFMFSMPSLIEKLIPKLEKEVDKGTRIVSIKFPIESEQFKQLKALHPDKVDKEIFLYKKMS
jgi:hypothetical protein